MKNALAAYDCFESWRPEAEKDLLAAHRILMLGLIGEAGLYRRSGVGVMAGKQVIHWIASKLAPTKSFGSVQHKTGT